MRINVKDEEKINKLLSEVQLKSRERNINIKDILYMIDEVEKKFKRCKKTSLSGLVVKCDYHAQTYHSKYRNTPVSTQVTITRIRSVWYVVGVGRLPQNKFKSEKYRIEDMSDNLKAEIINSYKRF